VAIPAGGWIIVRSLAAHAKERLIMDIAIVGAGIGGLVLALELHRHGLPCQVYEAAPEIKPLGVGINILPHASRVLSGLGLEEALSAAAVLTAESVFFNRFGQFIYGEPAGRNAGYRFPQYSIHRGRLHAVLLGAVRERLGADAVLLDHRCTGVSQDEDAAYANFRSSTTGATIPRVRADAVIGCDGVHSVIRRQFHPDEGEPRYSGVNMWRGITIGKPFLSGASMVRAGWMDRGKLVAYPIKDANGHQLLNWLAEIETPRHVARDWNRRGELGDFIGAFEDWHFDWLDVPAMMRANERLLEYPMVDQDPVDRWTFGRVTLLGDAAHPMVPRGSNGAGQSILDAEALSALLAETRDPEVALKAYENRRLPATTQVVLTNRDNPPDSIIREVRDRTGDRPFARIEDVIGQEEMAAISQRYKDIAGLSAKGLRVGD
jgi:2-polyprenyl-6-methoxyphenol hydroxylase-like FAD-dependent oxidoreductase